MSNSATPAVETVIDGYATLPPAGILVPPPGVDPDWETNPAWFGADGWRMPFGSFLIRVDGHVVLVDAGLGPTPVSTHDTGYLPDALRAIGTAPEDVTDVVLTHLHIDHLGWVSRRGTLTFPNAVHHWHSDDWEHIRSGKGQPMVADERVVNRLLPAADVLRLAAGPRTEVAPSVVLRHVPGHTPGNCVVEIGEGEGKVLLLGDTAHHPVTLAEHGWEDCYDVDRAAARRARAELADELVRTGAIAVGSHFADARPGRLVENADGRRRWELV